MMAKAASLPADQVFLDLEDSVAVDAKVAARGQVIEALLAGDWTGKTIVVRVNDCTTQWTYLDVVEVVTGAGARLDCIMVPKVQDAGQVAFVSLLLDQLEVDLGLERGRIGLELQIENASGLVHLASILAASRRTEAVIFGPGDMAAALEMPSLTVGELRPDYPGDHWHAILVSILIHARHAGVAAIDGPYAKIADPDGFREAALRSRTLGFDGKWVLHPSQIEIANDVFGVSQDQFDRAMGILEAMRVAAAEHQRGAVRYGDEMIDEATRKLAEVTARRGREQGLTESSTTTRDVAR